MNSGSAYVFKYNGTHWNEYEKLTVSDGASGDLFGGSVSIYDMFIIIGANRNGFYLL